MMDFFSDLWAPGVPVLEKVVRSVLVYFFLLIALRLGGKRELGQLTGFDLVVLLLLSNAVQNAIIGSDNSVLGGFIGAAALLITNYLVVRFAYRYPRIQHLIEGKPALLVYDGQIIAEHLAAEVITEAELRANLRQQGFDDLAEVKLAVLETSGRLTVERQMEASNPEAKEMIRRLDRIEEMLKQSTSTNQDN